MILLEISLEVRLISCNVERRTIGGDLFDISSTNTFLYSLVINRRHVQNRQIASHAMFVFPGADCTKNLKSNLN